MADYSGVIQVGASMLATIMIAFVLCRFKLIPVASIGCMNRFLLKCCYLPLLASDIAVRDLYEIYFTPAIVSAVTIISCQILLAIAFLLPLHGRFLYYVSSLLPAVFINYLIVGIPVFNAIWPESENVMIAVMTLGNDLLIVPSFLVFSNIYQRRKRNKQHELDGDGIVEKFSPKLLGQIAMRVLLNPIVFGSILGYVYAGTGWKMCPFLGNLMNCLANAVLALSLFCVGGFLSQHSFIACHWAHFLVCILIRHVGFPGIVALLSMAFKLSGRLTRQCVLMACNPAATGGYILAADAKIGQGISSTMIFWSTLLCVPMQLAWLYTFDSLNLFPDEGPTKT